MSRPDDTSAQIRAEMGRQKMSGRELARRLGESPMWVQRRVSGTGPISIDDLTRIAAVLDVPAARLLPERAAS